MAFPVTLNGRTYTLTDFEGTNYVDGLPDAFEDFVTHAGDIYNSTSTTSNSIGTGSKTFTVEANKPYQAGTPLRIADAAAPSTNFLDTVVTSYSGTTLVVNSIGYGGSGTKTSWTVNIGGAKTVDGTLGLSQGGTGATDAAAARTNLDVYSKADADSRFLNVSGEASDVTITGNTTIRTTGNTTNLTIESTDADANVGPRVDLYRNSASPADSDLVGDLRYLGENDAGQTTEFASIEAKILDVTDGTEDGQLDIRTIVDGTSRSRITITQTETVFNDGGRDLNFRVEGDTKPDLFFIDAGTESVGIGLDSPTAAGLHIESNVNNTYSDTIPYQTHTGDSLVIFNTPDSGGDDYVAINMLARGAQTSAMRHIVTSPGGGDTDYIWQFRDSADTNNTTKRMIYTSDGSLRYFPLASTETAFNEDGVNHDFRVESDSNTHALFVDAGDNYVGVNTSTNVSNSVLIVDGMIAIRNTGRGGTGDITKTQTLSRSYTMSTSATNVLEFDDFGNGGAEITVFRRDATAPSGCTVSKLYIAFQGSGTSITGASMVQDNKVGQGSIHQVTYTITENNNTATLVATGTDNGGEAQTLVFHCLTSGAEQHHIDVL